MAFGVIDDARKDGGGSGPLAWGWTPNTSGGGCAAVKTSDSHGHHWSSTHETMKGAWSAPRTGTARVTVDMDARGMLVSVNGGAAVDAEVKLPEAVRLYCWLYSKGNAVRLESVRSIGGAAAPSPSGAEKRLTAAEVDSMKVSAREGGRHGTGKLVGFIRRG